MTVPPLVQAAQVAAPIVAAVAAVASWRSANASLRTAGRADQTARRAVEALSRSTMPRLGVELKPGDASRDQPTVPVRIVTLNHGEHRGVVTAAYIERSDGFRSSAGAPLPVPIGTLTSNDQINMLVVMPVGDLQRAAAPDDNAELISPALITATVEYQDASGLVTWTQAATFRERWRPVPDIDVGPDATTLSYEFLDVGRLEPTILGDPLAAVPRRPGWLRRFVYWIW